MAATLHAGAGRRAINPAIGTTKAGFRLFADPIQAIESDLTATALVLSDGRTKVALLALDLVVMSPAEAGELRGAVASALEVPVAHVLLNLSHSHSSPGLPSSMWMVDTPEEAALRSRYWRDLRRLVVEAGLEADRALQPARLGCGWGESDIGVYRREVRDGRDVLGEVPGHPVDASVGVLRFDDLDGSPIATAFRFSCHPVTVGPRSMVASADFPGPARRVLEDSLGGLALFLQGCGGNVNPVVGIGYEIDCRETKDRIGLRLGGEALKVAAQIRTNTRAGERRPLGTVPNILFTPWEPVDGETCTHLAAAETTVALDFVELPPLAEAQAMLAGWEDELEQRQAREAPEWEIRVAKKQRHWARLLVAAVERGGAVCELPLQALRVNDVALLGIGAEAFFQTGLDLRARSPLPDTLVLGYTNGVVGYLPLAEDHPEGGWRYDGRYAVPDLIPQAWDLPAILAPDSERRVVEAGLDLLGSLAR